MENTDRGTGVRVLLPNGNVFTPATIHPGDAEQSRPLFW
jgi:hypothetical protein